MKRLATLCCIFLATSCAGADGDVAQTEDALHAQKVLSGCYTPRFGFIRAAGYSPLDAVGTYGIVAVHSGWSSLSAAERAATTRHLRANGSLKGTVDPTTGNAAHVQSTFDRGGFLFTAEDTLAPTGTSGCVVEGVQTLNYVAGSGRFAALTSGSIALEGTFNQCPTNPDFGHVDLRLQRNVGEICFAP